MTKNKNSWTPATEWVDEFTRVKAVEVDGEIVHEYYNFSWLHRVYWESGDRPAMLAYGEWTKLFERDVNRIMEFEAKRGRIKIRSFGFMDVVFAEIIESVYVLACNESDWILLKFFAGKKDLDVIYRDFINNRYDYAINKLSSIARLRATE